MNTDPAIFKLRKDEGTCMGQSPFIIGVCVYGVGWGGGGGSLYEKFVILRQPGCFGVNFFR